MVKRTVVKRIIIVTTKRRMANRVTTTKIVTTKVNTTITMNRMVPNKPSCQKLNEYQDQDEDEDDTTFRGLDCIALHWNGFLSIRYSISLGFT
mmetsp:Transcript_16831/g.36722  ORF Transcript_16831/g.36722 Transcript_16831/m.36722 type:complete len:93 (-) Transcript_16831:170-448(-)